MALQTASPASKFNDECIQYFTFATHFIRGRRSAAASLIWQPAMASMWCFSLGALLFVIPAPGILDIGTRAMDLPRLNHYGVCVDDLSRIVANSRSSSMKTNPVLNDR